MILQTLHGEIIGVVGSYFNLDMQIKFADVSEISFSVPAYDNGVPTPFYDDIQSYRMVQIDPYGIYVLQEPNVSGDGVQEVKEVSASSIEILLSNKRITLEEGTYSLDTIMGFVREVAPDWTYELRGSVGSNFRTFDQTDESLLDWLRNTASKSYGCLFDFDPYTKKITVFDAYEDYDIVPIYLTYDNLLKQQDISTSIKDFFTVLRVSGADPVDIREVNPIGTNRIYNLDYFIENGDISGELATKWRRWQDEIYLKQDYFMSLNTLYNSAVMRKIKQEAKIADLNGERDSIISQRSVTEDAIANATTDAIRQNQEAVYAGLTNDLNAKEAEIASAKAELNTIQSEIDSHNTNRTALVNQLRIENYFTAAELESLYPYFIESDFTDDTFATFDVDISGSNDEFATSSSCGIRITASNEDDVVDVDVASIDPNNTINKRIILLNGGTVDITVDNIHINAEILSGTFEQDKTSNNVVCSIYTGFGTSTSGGETKSFGNGSITITATKVTYASGSNPLSSATLTNPNLYFTKNTTQFETYAVQKELYDHATKEHESIAFPGCEFDIKSGNVLFARDFEKFKDVLTPGKGLYLELSDHTVLTPLLLEVHFSFEDPTNFDLIFSNTFQRHDNVTNMKKLLEQARSTARTLDMSKYNYGAFKRNGAENEVRILFTQGLDAATKQILAGRNNSVVIDSAGITITNPDDPTVCLRMNNGMFAFMDGSQHAQLAIGKFYDTGLGKTMYGVVAPNVVGTLLAGENLVINSPKFDGTNMYFTVDENGVRLANGQFDIYRHTQTGGLDVWGKSISLDPQLGILAGDLDDAIVYNNDGSVQGVKVGNSLVVKSMSGLSSVGNVAPNFWVDLDGNVFLKGTIYATNGEFSGVLNASTINGTLTAGANGGDIRGASIHVGGQDYSNFIVDSDGNVTINGNVSFGSNMSGDMADFVNNVTKYIDDGDAEVTAWFYDYAPTLSNAPASSWTTNAMKDEHIGDYFFDKKNDVAYRFAKKSDGTYAWVREVNTATVEALRAAAKAQDTADGKRRTFVGSSNPTPPYDVGDLWTNGVDLKTCVKAKAAGASYAASDWAVQVGYTNDDTANSIANGTYNGGTFIDKTTIYAPAIRGGATLGVGTNANAAKGYNLFVDADGSIKLGANNNTASKYNFYVDKDGNVTMNGGITLAGNITWSAGSSSTQTVYAQTALAKPANNTAYSSFPSTSTTAWHKTVTADDYYVSYTYDGGATWTDAVLFRGTVGQQGPQGPVGPQGPQGPKGDSTEATVTRASILKVLTSGSNGIDGIYKATVNGQECIRINATYIDAGVIDVARLSSDVITTNNLTADKIKAGTIDATSVTLGSSTYGGLAVGYGSTGKETTQGALMYAGSDKNAATNYVIATNGGVRMSASDTEIYVVDSYATMRAKGGVFDTHVTVTQTGYVNVVGRDNYSYIQVDAHDASAGYKIKIVSDSVVLKDGSSVTSDRNKKNTITYGLDRYENMFLALKPAYYKMNDGRSGRFHVGFIYQDVEDALLDSGLSSNDFAALVKFTEVEEDVNDRQTEVTNDGDVGNEPKEETVCTLRYSEFISLNTYMIQKLYARVTELENQIRLLSGGNE